MKKGLKVKIWMLEQDVRSMDIAKDYGCDSGMVARFLKGERTSRGLVRHMVRIGCPKEYFKDGKVAA